MPHKPYRTIPDFTAAQADAFWSQVRQADNIDDCWEWAGPLWWSCGYGDALGFNAHRVAWFLFHDRQPGDLLVMHKCDNRKCCNPYHLTLGTHKDNTADMLAKGRHRTGPPSQPRRPIPDDVVAVIRSSGKTAPKLAKEYGVSLAYIYQIKSGKARCQK